MHGNGRCQRVWKAGAHSRQDPSCLQRQPSPTIGTLIPLYKKKHCLILLLQLKMDVAERKCVVTSSLDTGLVNVPWCGETL
ncbi:rCG62447 [Rattus norvegicus]|uniref:RCG62447 n=1 Tax=Rattus norvegicus TaxID=10116 RepID=A6J5M5_RAT|nr:rCG62447 [Rattus norvegicus]